MRFLTNIFDTTVDNGYGRSGVEGYLCNIYANSGVIYIKSHFSTNWKYDTFGSCGIYLGGEENGYVEYWSNY